MTQALFPLLLLAAVLAGCGSGGTTRTGSPDSEPQAPRRSLKDTFASGELSADTRPRVAEGGLRVIARGARTYVLAVKRDEAGRESRRLVATAEAGELWAREEAPSERFMDFTVHPSGELTLGLERTAVARDAYDLVRLGAGGRELARQALPRPTSIPASDLSPTLPASPFRMKGVQKTSVVTGWLPWLELEARGEDAIAGILSYVDLPDGSLNDAYVVSGVMALRWEQDRYVEEWARMVDGGHSLIAVAWQYDEFLWLDAATRLLLGVDAEGGVVVGRTLGNSRCVALVSVFHELTDAECRRLRSGNSAHRHQPFAFTVFSPSGEREGTKVLLPDALEDFVIFDMALRGDAVAVTGTAVRLGPGGVPAYYFEPPNDTASTPLLPYDGYLAVVDLDTGTVRHENFVDLGRAEHFTAVRWTDDGLLAGGAAGWNRWYGGMSVSRHAEPLLALDPTGGAPVQTRRLEVPSDDRHAHLLGLDTQDAKVSAVGLFDAPMTHSGDGGRTEAMAFGGTTLLLR
jgi:hypothetical protein